MIWTVRDTKEWLVFRSLGSGAHPQWKRIEDDFVLGACGRHLFGYINRSPDGEWTAFDSDARPLGEFSTLATAKTALWGSHQPSHDSRYVPRRRRGRNGRGKAANAELESARSAH